MPRAAEISFGGRFIAPVVQYTHQPKVVGDVQGVLDLEVETGFPRILVEVSAGVGEPLRYRVVTCSHLGVKGGAQGLLFCGPIAERRVVAY
ncbi:hypothetical protein D3C77_691220 [compost metagenome]